MFTTLISLIFLPPINLNLLLLYHSISFHSIKLISLQSITNKKPLSEMELTSTSLKGFLFNII